MKKMIKRSCIGLIVAMIVAIGFGFLSFTDTLATTADNNTGASGSGGTNIPIDGEMDINHNTFFEWTGRCSNRDTGGGIIMCVLVNIFNWAAIGVAIAVVGGVIYGAILYTSSGGKSDQAKKGIGAIRNAIIALILYFIMFALLNFLVPGGLFA